MRSLEEAGKDGSTSGIGTETETGGQDGMEGPKERATKIGGEGTRNTVEAMKSGIVGTKNMADIEDKGDQLGKRERNFRRRERSPSTLYRPFIKACCPFSSPRDIFSHVSAGVFITTLALSAGPSW